MAIFNGKEILVFVSSSGNNGSVKLQQKTVTKNGEVTPDVGYDGLSKVTVNVSQGKAIEVESEDEMEEILLNATPEDDGKVYLLNGEYYILHHE